MYLNNKIINSLNNFEHQTLGHDYELDHDYELGHDYEGEHNNFTDQTCFL